MSQSAPAWRPSIRHNVFANYASQIYVTVISIAMAPVYLSYMGAESYGLIGFFTMMTGWFQLLDIGLTPTLSRETARFRGGAIDLPTLRVFLRALEIIFAVVSIISAAAIILLADQIAFHWLKVKSLPIQQVSHGIMLMGMTVPLRWVSSLYRSVIIGFERQVWLGGYNIGIATARSVGVVVVFMTLGVTPIQFFSYQLIVALIEVLGLFAMTYSFVLRVSIARTKFSWRPLLGNLSFSLMIAFAAVVWVVVTQTDKLVLSKLLPLSQYGAFSIAVLAAGGVGVIGAPFGQALLPRLTKLFAEKNTERMAALYGDGTQVVCVLVAPTVAVLCFFSEQVLRIWTGNVQLAHHSWLILSLYALGNGWVALCSFPYYLQYAKGDLRLHFVGTALQLVLLVPLVIWVAPRYGPVGTGAVWAILNSVYALVWVPIVHARVFKGQHWKWMRHDVLPIVIPTAFVGWLLALLMPWPSGRWPSLVILAIIGLGLLALASSGSSVARNNFIPILTRRNIGARTVRK